MAHELLEATISLILADIDADVDSHGLEACHRFGKHERTTKSRKNIVLHKIGSNCKKSLLNRKKIAELGNEKHQLGSSNNIFISEKLSGMMKTLHSKLEN